MGPIGEHHACIKVPILNDDAWNTTLEFAVDIFDPVDCELGCTAATRVRISDDPFPI